MAEICLNKKTFSKMLLHAAKYPHCAINGILLANKSNLDTKSIRCVDAIPLFHLHLTLSPMLEMAFQLIDNYCHSKGLIIVGYYQANEHLEDVRPTLIAHKVVERMKENCQHAYLFMFDNHKLSQDCDETCLNMYTAEKEGKWKKSSAWNVEEGASAVTSSLLRSNQHLQLVDFDNHLDDISKQWTNLFLDAMLDSAL